MVHLKLNGRYGIKLIIYLRKFADIFIIYHQKFTCLNILMKNSLIKRDLKEKKIAKFRISIRKDD